LLDGTPPRNPIVAKVFDANRLGGGGREEIDATRDLQRALAALGGPAWQAVLALVYSMFYADVKGRRTIVGLMLDLRPRGYEAPPFSEGLAKAYMKRPVQERIEIAIGFAERAALLEKIRFVHGDLNEKNLLVEPRSLDVQIIDFYAGAVATTGAEHPRTPGKPDGCMPPEVKSTVPGVLFDLAKFTIEAERWSVGMLMGYCLFGYLPTFFLNRISGPIVDEYSRHRRWPDIDTTSDLFTAISANKRMYGRLKRELSAFPEGARECFEKLFAAGLDGRRRPTAQDWVNGLTSLKKPPKVDEFDVDESLVFEGGIVELTWSVGNATHVELSPGPAGPQPPSGSAKVVVTSSTIFEIRAVNDYGDISDYGPVVRVLPIPRLEFVPVPTAPNFSFPTSIPIVTLGPSGDNWLPTLHAALAEADPRSSSVVPPAPPVGSFLQAGAPSALLPPAPDVRDLLTIPRTWSG
jgi:serine/threonine protein kinase